MRTYTDKDREGLSIALRTLLRNRGGRTRKASSLRSAVDRALAAGLSADEILNAANYSRAEAVMPDASAEDLIGCMAERRSETREITGEDGWPDDADAMTLISEAFHEFYIHICPKGGTWSTANARSNLEKAIRRNSLDAILSERLIMQVMEKSGTRDLTCFNYISSILRDPEDLDIEREPSEERRKRLEEDSQTVESLTEKPAEQPTSDGEETGQDGDTALATESEADRTDADLYPFDDDFGEEDWTPVNERTTFITPDPEKRKLECISASIYYLSPREIMELSEAVPQSATLKELVERLAANELDTGRESLQARKAHQALSTDLAPAFLECIRLQGIEISDEEIERHDPLTENWDFRDPMSRKKEKILQLIEKYGDDDPDLADAARDIEKLFRPGI